MTVISAYVSLFIGGRSPGENVQGECPVTATRGRRFPVLSPGAEYPSYATALASITMQRKLKGSSVASPRTHIEPPNGFQLLPNQRSDLLLPKLTDYMDVCVSVGMYGRVSDVF